MTGYIIGPTGSLFDVEFRDYTYMAFSMKFGTSLHKRRRGSYWLAGPPTGLGNILSRVEFTTLQQHHPLSPCGKYSIFIFNITDDIGISPELC